MPSLLPRAFRLSIPDDNGDSHGPHDRYSIRSSPPLMDDHYETLGLSHRRTSNDLNAQEIKQAYRKTLLKHHPDKLAETSPQHMRSAQAPVITVDQITVAYKTLSDPVARSKYDRLLAQSRAKASTGSQGADDIHYTGLDIIDLDDLEYDDNMGFWWRSCRCGQERGFSITENDLEKEASHGELFTGCRGCSLWLKVLFDSVDDSQAAEHP